VDEATILHGDCREVMAGMEPNSVDSIVTDPPYGLSFMGKDWDHGVPGEHFWAEALRVAKPGAHLLAFGGTRTFHRLAAAIEDAGWEIRDTVMWVYGSGFPKSKNIGNGWGTALKPAWEPVIVARKPLEGTVAGNVQKWGTGAVNVDGCRVGNNAGWSYPGGRGGSGWHGRESLSKNLNEPMAATQGRWPANLIHDGSDEVVGLFPDSKGQIAKASASNTQRAGQNAYGVMTRGSNGQEPRGDSGSAARFFYCAKASKVDRDEDNKHPTVKPTALMRYLCRLVTLPGGIVLDPFMGSGSTGKAALAEGFRFVGIERDAAYLEIARARIKSGRQQSLFSEVANG